MRRRVALLVLVACTAAGCADMRLSRTGFLGNYRDLAPAPDREVFGVPDQVHYHERPGVDWSRYRSAVVEPTAYVPTDQPHVTLDPVEQKELTGTFDSILETALATRFEIVASPRPDSIVVRTAITDVEASLPWLNWITVVLLVPTSYGGISGEMEIVDGSDRRRLLAMTATREGTAFLLLECFSRFGHAEHGMRKWARELVSSTSRRPAEAAGTPAVRASPFPVESTP